MKRVARKAAGKQVYRLADEHMAKAYAIEQEAHAEIRALMQKKVGAIEATVRQAVRGEGPLALVEDRRMEKRLRSAVVTVVSVSEEPVRWCLWRTGMLAVDVATEQMRWIERTMSKTFAGVTDEALAAARFGVAEIVRDRMADYVLAEVNATERFIAAVRKQAMLAEEAEDDLETVLARILSPEPVRAAGISGKGVWWRILGTISPAMTHSSVDVTNRTFEGCMVAFTEVGEAARG